jgi:hypothetical protein
MKECRFFNDGKSIPVCTEGNATAFCPHGTSRYARKHCPYSIWEETQNYGLPKIDVEIPMPHVEPALDHVHSSGQDPVEEKPR